MNKKGLKINGNLIVLVIALVAVIGVFSLLNHNYFTTVNMVNILIAASLVGLVAIGHTYLIIEGQNDLSPGSLVAFLGVLSALLVSKGVGFGVTLLITMVVGAIVGLCNAFMVNELRLEAFIATLVTQSIMRGFAYIICEGKPVGITDPTFIWVGKARLLGLPFSVWLMIVAFIIGGIILAKTRFGRSVYAIGGNAQAARLAGMNPKRIVTTSFVTMGLLCSIGGIVYVARLQSGQPAANINLEFDAITATVVGGTSFLGGIGTIGGCFLGSIILGLINNILNLLHVSTQIQLIVKGILIAGAVTIDVKTKENKSAH